MVINPTKQRIGQKIMGDAKRDQQERQRHQRRVKVAWAEREEERNRSNDGVQSTERPLFRSGDHLEKGLQLSATTFDEYNNDTWTMRERTLAKFVQSVSKMIIRHRCDKRVKAVKEVLAEQQKEAVVSLTPFALRADRVGSENWLAVKSDTPPDRQPVQLDAMDFPSFVLTRPLSLQVPFTFKLLDYEEASTEIVPGVVRKEKQPFFRVGALEEQSGRLPMGHEASFTGQSGTSVADDIAASLQPTKAAPANILRPYPLLPLETMRSDPALSVFSVPLAITEATPQYALLPQRLETTARPFFLTEEAGTESAFSLRGVALSDVAEERHEPILDLAFALEEELFPGLHLLGPPPSLLSGLPNDDAANLVDEEVDRATNLGFSATAPTLEAARALFAIEEGAGDELEASGGKTPGKEKKGAASDAVPANIRLGVQADSTAQRQRELEQQKQAERSMLCQLLGSSIAEATGRDEDTYVPPLVFDLEIR